MDITRCDFQWVFNQIIMEEFIPNDPNNTAYILHQTLANLIYYQVKSWPLRFKKIAAEKKYCCPSVGGVQRQLHCVSWLHFRGKVETDGKYEIYQAYLPALFLEHSIKISAGRIVQREQKTVRDGMAKMGELLTTLKLDSSV